MTSRPLVVLVRFVVAFGFLAWLAAAFPIYKWLERPSVAAANAMLHQSGTESRTLALGPAAQESVYVYDVRLGGEVLQIKRPMHAHGFIALVFASLVLATPGASVRRLALVGAIGALPVFALCTLMLMSDIALWEAKAVAEANLQQQRVGPYRIPLGFVAGLHQTGAAGLLPIMLWVLLAMNPAHGRG